MSGLRLSRSCDGSAIRRSSTTHRALYMSFTRDWFRWNSFDMKKMHPMSRERCPRTSRVIPKYPFERWYWRSLESKIREVDPSHSSVHMGRPWCRRNRKRASSWLPSRPISSFPTFAEESSSAKRNHEESYAENFAGKETRRSWHGITSYGMISIIVKVNELRPFPDDGGNSQRLESVHPFLGNFNKTATILRLTARM